MNSTDPVVMMFTELRTQRPAFHCADEYGNWEAAVGAFIANLPDRVQRWAAMMIMADDLRASGLTFEQASRRVVELVLRANAARTVRI